MIDQTKTLGGRGVDHIAREDNFHCSAFADQTRQTLRAAAAGDQAELAWQSCFGRCTQGPNVLVREVVAPEPGGLTGGGFATLPGPRGVTALYNRFDTTRAEPVVARHVLGGQIVREYIERPGPTGIGIVDPVASKRKESK